MLAGLLRPHGGSARVLGAELPGERWKLPGQVGYLGHEPLLYRELSARENLRYHAGCTAFPARAWRTCSPRSACEPCRRAGARPLGAWFSAGRRAAVLHDPPLLLLDEPRANLDPAAAELLEPLIGRASGRTRVLVTHDVQGALAEADVGAGPEGGPACAGRPRSCTGDRRAPARSCARTC